MTHDSYYVFCEAPTGVQSIGALMLDYKKQNHVSMEVLREASDAVWKAFEELWGEGVLHGDVRLDNICIRKTTLTGKYEVVIIDLGLAECFDGPVPQNRRWVDEDMLFRLVGGPSVP